MGGQGEVPRDDYVGECEISRVGGTIITAPTTVIMLAYGQEAMEVQMSTCLLTQLWWHGGAIDMISSITWYICQSWGVSIWGHRETNPQ